MKLNVSDERVLDLLSWWGVRYSWGAGRPSDAMTAWPPAPAPLGDLAFYGTTSGTTHVMLCLGDGVVYGARGGGSRTNGDDPRAFVQLEPIRYRPDLRSVGRLLV